ncbi:MAG: putative holin [Lysobacteraceae bacterium]
MNSTLPSRIRAFIGDQLRAWQLLLIFVVLIAIVVAMAPAKLGLTLYGFGKIVGGLYVGLWGDRLIFPYARPHEVSGIERSSACYRRAIIVGLCALASALIP